MSEFTSDEKKNRITLYKWTKKVSITLLEKKGEGNKIKDLDQHGIFTVNNKDFIYLYLKKKT